MIAPVQYLIAEDGQRVGVVLSWDDYQSLQSKLSGDPDLLNELDERALRALAEGMLASSPQDRLSDLLERNRNGQLDADGQIELDKLLERIDELNILKARALYTLQQRSQAK